MLLCDAPNSLRAAGEWIARYPQVVYDVEGSPWQHAMPWGDVTRKNKTFFLSVFHWPKSGELYLPNVQQDVERVKLLQSSGSVDLVCERRGKHIVIRVPAKAPEVLASVIELNFLKSQ